MEVYGLWLDTIGTEHFGAALDHGDVLEGLGDVEAGDVQVDVPDYPPPLDDEQAQELNARIRAVYDLSLIHLCRCRRPPPFWSRWSP